MGNDGHKTRKEKFEDYAGFVEKFKPKKTTDDCYTPPAIYEVVKAYACERYGIDPAKVVRPFWPGCDYTKEDYSGGKVVIDNPPFSILSQIVNYYTDKGVPFFLFAPSLVMSNSCAKAHMIICAAQVIYDNGAVIQTSFCTSYEPDIILESCPVLTDLINKKTEELKAETVKHVPKYAYPDYIITTAMTQKLARYGVPLRIPRRSASFVRVLDAQKPLGKTIYGSGFLLSEKAAAERAAAEKTNAITWTLSDRELEIVKELSKNDEKKED